MKRLRRILRRRKIREIHEFRSAESPMAVKRRRSHPVSAVLPFLAFIILLVIALFLLNSWGLKMSPLSLMFVAILLMLIGLAIFMAYSLHSKESEEELESFRGEFEHQLKERASGRQKRRRRV